MSALSVDRLRRTTANRLATMQAAVACAKALEEAFEDQVAASERTFEKAIGVPG